MKNALIVLASLALSAGLASASITFVSPCSVLMFPDTTGNTGSICTATPDPGFVIDSLTLTITDDYTGFQSGSPVVSYSGTLTESSAIFGVIFCNVTTGGSGSVPCSATITPSATATGLSLGGFTIQLTNAGNTVAGGVVTGASEVMTLSGTETPITTGTPEPATFGMMGAALVGLGFFARKRKR